MDLEFHQLEMKYEGMRISMPGFQARLVASLAEQGQQNPVLVVRNESAETEKYVLIDGYRRVSALRALGRDGVDAVKLPLDEIGALLFWRCQQSAQNRSAFEDGWLLRELTDIHGMSQAELSRRLHRSESWVSRRLSLVRELPKSVQELVRRGELSEHAAAKYMAPLARAKKSDCEKLGKNLTGHRVSSRQMERIYVTWKSGDAEQRKRVVEQPILFLKASAEENSKMPDRSIDVMDAFLKDVEIIGAVCARARQGLRRMRDSVMLSEIVVESWRSASTSFTALAKTLKGRIDVGP